MLIKLPYFVRRMPVPKYKNKYRNAKLTNHIAIKKEKFCSLLLPKVLP